MTEAAEGQLWVSATSFGSHEVCRVAASPTAKMVTIQTWSRGYGTTPGEWGRTWKRDKSCLKFRLPDDADPARIEQLIQSAYAERNQRRKAAEVAYLQKLEKLSA